MLTGHRKSGTSMLHALFDNHPELNIYPVDICLLYAFFPHHVNTLETKDYKKRIEHVLRITTLHLEEISAFPKDRPYRSKEFIETLWKHNSPEELITPEAIIKSLANAWCAHFNLDTNLPFLFKETSLAIHSHKIRKSGLNIKFINLIRDPRDNYAAIKSGVANYYSQMGEGEKESLASVINRARMDLLVSKQLQEDKLNWCKAVKFEDLVKKPKLVMSDLADFCDINYLESLSRPTLIGEQEKGNSHEGIKFDGISNINVNRWRERISEFEAGVIEFWMDDVMNYWGYRKMIDSNKASDSFREFYNWYNSRYFYYDSYAMAEK